MIKKEKFKDMFQEFHHTMMYDEFGEKGLTNNYYLLFGIIICYGILMMLGAIEWLIFLNHFQ